ncbi:MAG TPA: amidohydrolase family protein [Bryobacteraceae bacterium]|nr:amidohydrolase family protein [Bryobacteraceae bacterium]
MRRATLLVLLLSLCACKPAEEGRQKAIIGAVLIDGAGGPPLSDSVVVVEGGRILAAGRRSEVPIPAEADKINGAGKFLVPALKDLLDRAEPPDLLRPGTVDQARAQVAALAARRPGLIYLAMGPDAVTEAALEAARNAGIPVAGLVSTQAGARLMVDGGASALIGSILDTEDPDSALVRRMRDLRIVVAPALAQSGAKLAAASHNAKSLFQAGVPIALASLGADPVRECELLVAAGVPPLDVIVAATRNSAAALRQLEQSGTIEPGKSADLLLLSAHPGEDIRNLRQVALRMAAGNWVR